MLHKNIIECGYGDSISLIVADSVTASTFFADRSIDWVHLDARHDHEHVKADIAAWLPKVKVDGWLSGDDYDEIKWPDVVRRGQRAAAGGTALVDEASGGGCCEDGDTAREPVGPLHAPTGDLHARHAPQRHLAGLTHAEPPRRLSRAATQSVSNIGEDNPKGYWEHHPSPCSTTRSWPGSADGGTRHRRSLLPGRVIRVWRTSGRRPASS